MDELIEKMWYTHTMEYYLSMKKKEVLPLVTAWMDLKHIMLSKISQRKTSIVLYHTYVKSKQLNL